MGDEPMLTEPVMRPRPAPTQFTKDTRWLVVIVVLCIVVQVPGSTWSVGFPHAGSAYSFDSHASLGWTLATIGIAVAGFLVAVGRRGAARYDEHTVMGLALAGVVGITVLVWLLMPIQSGWVEWAVTHGVSRPFVLGNVTETVQYADYLG